MEQHKRYIKTIIEFPSSILSPLVKICFGEDVEEEHCYKKIISTIFPLYYQFENITGLGNIVLAKDMLNKDVNMLSSAYSLKDYRTEIENSLENKSLFFKVSDKILSIMMSVSYHRWEIMEFEEQGITDEEILFDISENSFAYYYWCLSRISEGKRIGRIGYKNRLPDLEGDFNELDMQKFIPKYDEKKSFSFEEKDVLCNASDEEIQERFLEMMGDFKKAIKNKENENVLLKMSKQIEMYSSKLKWDPDKFFKNIGWKRKT